ncbi:phage head spike fiber domain-containing protein, partial [Streptococcus pneumoniae]|uniref:phage head spike fiber domain-containing protein n=1 Tax=Streptococcus pneumoniae TaxID=1313 RepID=UPI00067AE663
MDALTRRQFDRAMFAKERTLAIRVGDYASRDIKEASFEYGYIKGDTYKPGGTCAGSGKITFTSIITTFNKLDTLHPEIGLLVGDTYQWVKMGEYFINDIEIDRNRNTTTLELMDGMFKLNREYVTDLHFPAEVREVIQEICLKTGIELANDYFGISAMRYHIEQVPEGKKLSFRDMLSAMTQVIGMSCFFNREGKMEIRDLTESNITINADSYFLHGLTKSEIEYQIAGITCKTDKKSLTVGMKTGRSLELDNVFMTQSALNDLYYKLKNLTYYPYNLNYQGHLLLEVGQWVTIQTNKKETFKVPVLSQSFTFKGGLRGRISADSKAGNDTQYSYEGTITKQIKQQDGFEAKIQAQIEAADKDFDQKVDKIKKDFNDQVELTKARAEEVKRELSDTINQRFNSFDNGPLKETKRKAEEALRNAGASTLLAQEAKRIGLDSVARLEAFKSQTTSAQTALSGDLDALKRTIANDIRPKQAQAEAEIAKQVEALSRTKNELAGVKSAQATYEETTTRRLSELTNLANGKASKSELTQTAEELASRIASVQAGSSRNYFRNSRSRTFTTGGQAVYDYRTFIVPDFWKNSDRFKRDYVRISFDVTFPVALVNDMPAMVHFSAHPWYAYRNLIFKGGTVERQHFEFTIDLSSSSEDYQTNNVFIRFGTNYGFPAGLQVVIENAMLSVGNYFPAYQPAYEDQEDRVSVVESNFKQRANSLDAGVSRLTEGLRTKADISSLNVTAENIRQSVKSLETDTQNKLNQKLSQAEFEVRAGSIRQEILNATKDKANKSELTQTAEELASKIASVQASGRNLFLNSLFKQDISKTGIWTTSTYTAAIDSESKYLGHNALKIIGLNPSGRDGGNPKVTYPALGQFGKVIPGSTTNQDVTISFYAKANKNGIMLRSRLGNIGYKTGNVTLSTEIKRYVVHIPKGWTNESKQTTNEWLFNFNQEGTVWIWMPKFEISDVDTSYSEAPEDIEGQISTVESTFKQRANSLDAGVSRLTEGLRTKVDISALNVTAENIRQSVKSLETDTQNKLNQKLSQAEFEVRAGSIRQEILNATKDKADKTLVVSEAGKLREEFSKMKVGGRNLWIKSKTVGAVIEKLPENHVTGQKECYRLENNSTLTFNLEPDFSSRLYQKVTFSAWIKYENVVQGRNFWNVFNCFKHYLFRKNSETGVQSGPDYATLGMYKGSADWKYITFTYDYSEKTNFDQLKTSLRFNLEGATSGTAWVTGIKVEIGSVAAKATFERTAQGLRTDLSAIQEYVNKDGQRQEALQRYTREESARQATAVRELVNRDFVGKATYQEDVKGINQRIEAVKTSANKDIASQIASYRQSVDGKFTDISSQITTYKQDVGGQISGLSNRLTSSEQGTTTQISNLSNRINSNKQGADNQISNLKTQVATNKDNAERQMGRISDQVSANKANADSQFANVTNQLARKVETTDFQRVKETSKLYERILGNTENGIADKVARMALTNQLFQVEVAKNASNGQNLLKGTKDFSGGWKNKGANWKKHAEKYKGVDVLFKNNSWNGVGQEIDAKIGEVYTFSLWMKSDWKNDTVNFYVNRNGSVEKGWGVPSETSVAITSEWKRYSFTFKITVDGFIFPRVERLNQNTNLYIAGLKLEKGSYATPYTEAPEDTDEAIRSVQSQLTGSWAVQNINSAGAIISGINLGANGHNRFVGKLTHITGETLIDRAVIKSAMVDKLKTANFEAGSVTTTILDAEAVTAEKLKVD